MSISNWKKNAWTWLRLEHASWNGTLNNQRLCTGIEHWVRNKYSEWLFNLKVFKLD